MGFHYEVVAASPLTELFRQRFLQNMRETKGCEMFRLTTPDAASFWEFKRGNNIFTLSFTEEAGGQMERIVIESDTLDLSDVVISVVKSGLSAYLVQFLLPLTKIPRTELESRIKAYLSRLQTELL